MFVRTYYVCRYECESSKETEHADYRSSDGILTRDTLSNLDETNGRGILVGKRDDLSTELIFLVL